MATVPAFPVEILALERGTDQGKPICLFTYRLHPEICVNRWMIMLTPEQCIRIRDTLDGFLNDQDSWLYTPKAKQREMRVQE
jgi:hypothetical protein